MPVMLRTIKRTKWLWVMLFILGLLYLFAFPQQSTMKLVAYKLFIGVCAFLVAHVAVKSVYDVSLTKLLENDKSNEIPDALKFLGASFLRAIVMAAFIIGVMLGI
jgi:hypothetical protein